MKKPLYILIMAGGEGTRFYPISTPEKPKQFLSFWGGRTFIQQTYDRISALAPASKIFVATNRNHVGLVRDQLPEIPETNIIGEPVKKNTAPCIAYATRIIADEDKDALMLVLPSDHLIEKREEFLMVIDRAIYLAEERDVLVTLGVQPTWPADCYGYIKTSRMIEDDPGGKWHAYIVDQFVEKPSAAVAKEYIDDGTYLWNSGMFVWKAVFILSEIKKHLPTMHTLLDKYAPDRAIGPFFKEVENISIDYGVMERSNRVITIPCDIGWHDIGTWESLYNVSKIRGLKLDPRVEEEMEKRFNGQTSCGGLRGGIRPH